MVVLGDGGKLVSLRPLVEVREGSKGLSQVGRFEDTFFKGPRKKEI